MLCSPSNKIFRNKFQKPYFLDTVLVTLQEQPSPPPRLVKFWTGELMRENLLSISKFLCRQTAGRQLKPFFIPVKFYIVKLPCSCTTAPKWKYNCCQVWFPFFLKLNCLFVYLLEESVRSQRDSSMPAFLTVSCRLLR